MGKVTVDQVLVEAKTLSRAEQKQSATSGKAGGLKYYEPLKAERGYEPLTAVRS